MKAIIFSIDDLHKSFMVSHEPKKPPKMEPRIRKVRSVAEGYKPPQSRPNTPEFPKKAFKISRKKGPEETKRANKIRAREKRVEKREEIETYGTSLED